MIRIADSKFRISTPCRTWFAAGLCALLAACSAHQSRQTAMKPPIAAPEPAAVAQASVSAAAPVAAAADQSGQETAYADVVASPRQQLGKPYEVGGNWYRPEHDPEYDEVGLASWYGAAFDGRLTANGEVFDQHALSGAHPTLPLPSYVRVTNIENRRSVIVRVNDRGPFSNDRLVDVSSRTADLLGFKADGVAKVRVEFLKPAPLEGDDSAFLLASYVGPDLPGQQPVAVAAREPAKRITLASRAPFDPFRTLSRGLGLTEGPGSVGFSPRPRPRPAATGAGPIFTLRSSYAPARVGSPAFQAIEALDLRSPSSSRP